jgi:hypothetical protein
MTGRELVRRRVALGLLTALPLAFYGAQAHHSSHAAVTGGIAMAFSIAGASIFAALTARPVDERLVLAGLRAPVSRATSAGSESAGWERTRHSPRRA